MLQPDIAQTMRLYISSMNLTLDSYISSNHIIVDLLSSDTQPKCKIEGNH